MPAPSLSGLITQTSLPEGKARQTLRRALLVCLVSGMSVLCVACADLPKGPLVTPAMLRGTPPLVEASVDGPAATSRAAQLESLGYTEQEWTLSGTARTYEPDGDWTRDGLWTLREAQAPRPYRTRILVRHPTDPSRFNGTVVVEWLNTALGFDLDGGWALARDEILREGYAWVGVSTEAAGHAGLMALQPQRYAAQDIPSQALAYDIFTQAGEAVQAHARTLLGSEQTNLLLLAMGFSQSVNYLITYLNAFQPLTQTYAGALLHGGAPIAAPVNADSHFGYLLPRIRSDLRAPVLQIQTEMEASISWPLSSTADTDHLRYWEVAGAAHFNKDMQDQAAVVAPPSFRTQAFTCYKPISTLPTQVVDHAALHALRTWALGGPAPAKVPRMARSTLGFIRSDADGNAIGGWRLPEIEAPIARYGTYSNIAISGISLSSIYRCMAGGSTLPFDTATLVQHHGKLATWRQRYQASADALLQAGLMRPADHAAALAWAQAQSWPPATPSPAATPAARSALP